MLSPERIGAFIEYVARPMVEDIRFILDKAKELNLPISERLIIRVGASLAISHFLGECIRAATYIVIAWLVCQTIILTMPW